MLIYHMARAEDWEAQGGTGRYLGSADDLRDGFIHFSTREQVAESAAKHRAGEEGLLLLAVETDRLGPALRWEPSRGGALFPHLYGPIPPQAVVSATPLPIGRDGRHRFPWQTE